MRLLMIVIASNCAYRVNAEIDDILPYHRERNVHNIIVNRKEN